MAKRASEHQRTRRFTTWLSPHDHKRLVARAARAGAKTVSAYIRAAALGGREFEMPSYEMQREQWFALIRLAAALESLPPSKLVNETLIEAKATLARMCRS
jgi:hypothetical protein